MILYLSGPMTGLPDYNYPAFNNAAGDLLRAGYDVLNPADTGLNPEWEWTDYVERDIALVFRSDGVALLDGWQKSKGARLENAVAAGLSLPRFPVHTWTAAGTKAGKP